MFISIGLFIIIYYAWFRNYLRMFSSKAANIATNETTLVEKIPARIEEEVPETQTSETVTSVGNADISSPMPEPESAENEKGLATENSPDDDETTTDENGELNPDKSDS